MMLKMKYSKIERGTYKMTYQCEKCYEVIDPRVPEDVIIHNKDDPETRKEHTVFSRRYISISHLDLSLCHSCFQIRLDEENHAPPVISDYEKKMA